MRAIKGTIQRQAQCSAAERKACLIDGQDALFGMSAYLLL